MANRKEVVERVRAKYPADNASLGAMINEVAWQLHGEDPAWGLSAKPAGNSETQPKTGIKIAGDIVQYGPTASDGTAELYDVFAGDAYHTPAWGLAGQHDQPSRVWVAPVEPEGATTPPPPPAPDYGPQVEALRRDLDTLTRVLNEWVAETEKRIATVEAPKPFPALKVVVDPAAEDIGTSRSWGHAHTLRLGVVLK